MSNTSKPRTLFILRKREDSWGQLDPYTYNSSGLLNSAAFINDMLIEDGFESKLVQVRDTNKIDKEVYDYNPDIVVLEAIWCPPAKLRELVKLHHHKHRKWIVRNHSEIPFLGFEGVSLEWMMEYPSIHNVFISCNSPIANQEFEYLTSLRHGKSTPVYLLPNYYPTHKVHSKQFVERDVVDVGCFGAIRPLKNTLQQAVASIIFARSLKKKLRFHVNSSRIEDNAHPVLKSIRALFKDYPNCELVEVPWMNRENFLSLCGQMDIGLQVSYSETFNIVTADLVSRGVPVVCSSEIPWIPERLQADPSSALNIAEVLLSTYGKSVDSEVESLREYGRFSKKIWIDTLLSLKG